MKHTWSCRSCRAASVADAGRFRHHRCASARRFDDRVQRPDIDQLVRFVSSDVQQSLVTRELLDVRHIDNDQGWGFVSLGDVDDETVLVRVPLSKIIVGVDDDHAPVPWNVQMVAQVLEQMYSSTDRAWLESLPVHVDLPFLYWTDDEVALLADSAIIDEIKVLRDFVCSDDIRNYFSTYEWKDVLWAFSMVHSRSFLYAQGQHLLCPLIDMANHSDHPNATVKLTFNVDSCQGQQAIDEIAPPSATSTSAEEQSLFELVTTRGIDAGEQVCISYGAQPNDVLLLYFGFALSSNANDAVTFTGQDVVELIGVDTNPHLGAHDRFFVTREGVDPRLSELLPSPAALVELCERKLDRINAIEASCHRAHSTRANTAKSYRQNKIALLSAVIVYQKNNI